MSERVIRDVLNVTVTKDEAGIFYARLRKVVVDEIPGPTKESALVALATELEFLSDYLAVKRTEIHEAIRDSYE